MKRTRQFTLLAVLGGLLACGGSPPAGPPAAGDAAHPPEQDALLDSLQQAEAGLWRAVQRQDSAAFDRTLAPDYVYFSSLGRKDRDKATEIGMHIGSGVRIDSLEFSHWRSRWVSDSVAVLDYLSKAWGAVGGQRDSQFAGALAIWTRRGGQWQAVARTEWAVPWDLSSPSDSMVRRLRPKH
jgi:hypothetical protein